MVESLNYGQMVIGPAGSGKVCNLINSPLIAKLSRNMVKF